MSNYCFTLALLRLFDFHRAFDDFPLFHLWLSLDLCDFCLFYKAAQSFAQIRVNNVLKCHPFCLPADAFGSVV